MVLQIFIKHPYFLVQSAIIFNSVRIKTTLKPHLNQPPIQLQRQHFHVFYSCFTQKIRIFVATFVT